MAANKFATMLHRNTHRINLILVYAVLEWILIILLLLNSLFSYLIMKFAEFFGLKPPCLWCSRVDHIFEPGKNKNSYRDLVCEIHANEISNLGYCLNHQKLSEAQDMCEDCSSSRSNHHGNSIDITRKIALFSWVKEMGMISNDGETKKIENGDQKDPRCSCCDVSLSSKLYSPYLLFKPSWGVLDYTQKGNLITGSEKDGGENSDLCKSDYLMDQEIERNREEEEEDDGVEEHQMLSDFDEFAHRTEEVEEDGDEDDSLDAVKIAEEKPLEGGDSNMSMEDTGVNLPSTDETMIQVCHREDASFEIIPIRSENCSDYDRLVPNELIDFTTAANRFVTRYKEEDQGKNDHQEELFDLELQIETQVELVMETRSILGKREAVLLVEESDGNNGSEQLEAMEMRENENSSNIYGEECKEDITVKGYEEVAITQATQTDEGDLGSTEEAVNDSDILEASEEDAIRNWGGEAKPEILTGREMAEAQEHIPLVPSIQEDPSMNDENTRNSTNSDTLMEKNDQGSKQLEDITLSVATLEQGRNHHLSFCSDLNEIMEDEKAPETPSYVEGLDSLHKKLLLLEKKVSGTEESLDGSFISELEGCEGVAIVDRLKSALKAERKVLNALYSELEEERSASAIAANQTMAMITRIQEEKAAMQMEALQYQRMMEEQSEYDQEALQLLNELMVKREKENQELEKELEIYRKKVIDYEAKEKRMIRRKDRRGRSMMASASSSNAEDSEELSIDLNYDGKDEDSFDIHHQETSNHNTPMDAVLNLEGGAGIEGMKHLTTIDESLAYFEEERLSILEQLKALEEKLFTMADDDEEQFFEDVKPIEYFSEENGEELANGFANGYSEDLDEKHFRERRTMMRSKAKRLLPLFDAIGMESEDEVLNEEQEGSQNSSVSKSAVEKRKLAIEEEVDHVYERLQALEEDREFLKHCITSLRKGDKGRGLLQEILQHLRDLRTMELRARNMSDGALA